MLYYISKWFLGGDPIKGEEELRLQTKTNFGFWPLLLLQRVRATDGSKEDEEEEEVSEEEGEEETIILNWIEEKERD